VSRPIVKSTGSGESNGALIFGIFLGQKELEHLISLANVQFELIPVISSRLPDDMKMAMYEISDDVPVALKIINKDQIAGYTVINDIANLPQLVLKISMERVIAKKANNTILFLHLILLIVGIIYCVFFSVIMEKTVTARIASLNTDVNKISHGEDPALRVSCKGNDELTLLSKSINSMLDKLEDQKKELSRYNDEMSLIMNTLQIGLFSINESFIINPVHSRSSEVILGQSTLAGKDIFTVLQIHPQTKLYNDFMDFLSLLKIGALPDSEMQGLNPCDELQLKIMDKIKWVRLEFFQMHRVKLDQDHILVELKDITNEKLLTEKIKQSEQENIQLKAIAEDPELFNEYLYESIQILEQAEITIRKLEEDSNVFLIHEVFRNIHLLKGSSDSFEMAEIAQTAGILEDELDKIRNANACSSENIASIKSQLLKLSQIIYHTITHVKSILGEEHLLEHPQIILKLSLDKLQSEYGYIITLLSENIEPQSIPKVINIVRDQFRRLRLEPARKGFSKTFKAVPSLIKRLNKNCNFIVKGENCLIDCILARKLNEPLLHTIRNAFDHGVEPPWERLEKGKKENATIICSFRREVGLLIIEISDDGRGIDPDIVFRKAKSLELVPDALPDNPTRDQILDLIFLPGFSTTDTVSMVSGRGVGLYSVHQVIKVELGGSIKISTCKNSGTSFTFIVPETAEIT
jgi:signal transduction histidine kinase